mgnify:CR=1 FL=1
MDFALIIIGIFALCFRQAHIAFVVYYALATNYFYFDRYGISSFLFPHNISDSAFLMFFIIALYGIARNKRYKYELLGKIFPVVFLFGVSIIILLFVDLMHEGDILSAIKTSRHWIVLFAAYFVLPLFSPDEYYNVIKWMLYATVFVSCLILSDYFIGTTFKGSHTVAVIDTQGNFQRRGAHPAAYASFYLLYLVAYMSKGQSDWKRWTVCIVLMMTIFLSLTRSMIITQILSIIAIVVMVNRSNTFKLVQTLSVCLVGMMFVPVLFPALGDRLSGSVDEVVQYVATGEKARKGDGTMAFRLDHLKERFDYVASNNRTLIFGIGNITEKEFPNIFRIGLFDRNRGRTTQLDTGDIAWSILILRLGVIGVIAFCLYWLYALKIFALSSEIIGKVSFVYLLSLIPLSICSTFVASGYNWVFVMMLLCLARFQTNLK